MVLALHTDTDQDTFPTFCFGAGVFSGAYSPVVEAESHAAVRRALDRGVQLFDTSPYYGESERVLGDALRHAANAYPRQTYRISTKIGRYGLLRRDFDYSAERVRASVAESLRRLGTDYLDIVFCHDVEFVDEEMVLDQALPALFELKDKGVIRMVGISGYPLEVLLRIAEAQAARGRPLDILLSYCHYTLQNTRLAEYTPRFRAAGIRRLLNASPLSMGLLRDADAPAWHPVGAQMREVVAECARLCRERGRHLADLALQYAMAYTGADAIVVGCSTPKEVDCALAQFRATRHTSDVDQELLETVLAVLAPYRDYSWPSPPADA
ncbi:NADP-dependent oxidoreductase domain-containing protein [Thamnocephalis sphaerospora]|uniref:NADP-dependent oxidoreductase domain-containing protein n=1 Tax=Thamnocephalis sphaerospora TaxID=78915 RepID=A0A4P9XYB2_9FUNG|nr:NADP-dependent oxidoreductase domain-containing protein [Thamnocephalis sphaerospora]|eukprot:RKP10420.1 NADP-dependent oxidoreductase domain-containing protein [Thamnocephalis sphaerospora]